jgi:hypothetical protein
LENHFELKNDESAIEEIESKVNSIFEVSDDSSYDEYTSKKHNKSKRKE